MRREVYNSGIPVIVRAVGWIWFSCALFETGCGTKPPAKSAAPYDPTTDAWYQTATSELTGLSQQASAACAKGNMEGASQLIERGEHVAARLIAVPRPSLSATQAASDLDELYGQMLFRNRHYGWARMQFQKNVARWKHWNPQTADSAKRRKTAEKEIVDCDRRIEQP